uniref:Uncharacterized protein n=1 Tax=Escherichia coli TaxID=562 RepID=A0A0C5B388_ECOLX|nr:hypothetical protein EL78_p6512 [Escherichia coli]
MVGDARVGSHTSPGLGCGGDFSEYHRRDLSLTPARPRRPSQDGGKSRSGLGLAVWLWWRSALHGAAHDNLPGFLRSDLGRASELLASALCCLDTCCLAFEDELAFHLGEAGHYAEYRLSDGAAQVDALADADQGDLPLLQLLDQLEGVPGVPADAIDRVNDQGVALLQQLVQEDAEGRALAWWYRPADPVVGKDGGGWEPGDDGVSLAVAGLFVG